MGAWQCNLCSHVYDETRESMKWENLPDDWTCPICGSPKSSFTVVNSSAPSVETVPGNEESVYAAYECGLCSFLYDETKETLVWKDLPEDWSCPVCGSGKTSFAPSITAAPNLLAMGADAVALGTTIMMALGCQQYRICDTGKCPVGIATQDPALRARLDVDQSAARVANFFKVSTEEIKDFARLSGNENVHSLSLEDICTTNSEISNHTNIKHV